jgi:hypothetical protein
MVFTNIKMLKIKEVPDVITIFWSALWLFPMVLVLSFCSCVSLGSGFCFCKDFFEVPTKDGLVALCEI